MKIQVRSATGVLIAPVHRGQSLEYVDRNKLNVLIKVRNFNMCFKVATWILGPGGEKNEFGKEIRRGGNVFSFRCLK